VPSAHALIAPERRLMVIAVGLAWLSCLVPSPAAAWAYA
jgi:hypothetical protein